MGQITEFMHVKFVSVVVYEGSLIMTVKTEFDRSFQSQHINADKRYYQEFYVIGCKCRNISGHDATLNVHLS